MRKFLYTALLLGAIAAHPGWGQSGVSNFDVRDSAPLPEQAKAMVSGARGCELSPIGTDCRRRFSGKGAR
jgi:hypothetical protein